MVPDACDTCPGFDDAAVGNPCAKLFTLDSGGAVLRIANPYSLRTLYTVGVSLTR